MLTIITTIIILVSIVISILLKLNIRISGYKIMLLGINITLIGGIMAVDKNINYGGIVNVIAILC